MIKLMMKQVENTLFSEEGLGVALDKYRMSPLAAAGMYRITDNDYTIGVHNDHNEAVLHLVSRQAVLVLAYGGMNASKAYNLTKEYLAFFTKMDVTEHLDAHALLVAVVSTVSERVHDEDGTHKVRPTPRGSFEATSRSASANVGNDGEAARAVKGKGHFIGYPSEMATRLP